MSEWKEVKISDIVIFKNGKKRPSIQGNIPVYGGNGIMDYANEANDNNNIIVGRVGAYCGCVYLSKGQCWVSDNAISVKTKQGTDTEYLYYLLQNLNLNHHQIGGAQPLMTQDIIGRIVVKIPKSEEQQQKISSILSSLDDKNAINRRICQNLEEQAQALFKHWFVDFAPFKDGKFVESELGMIPEGWRVQSLTEIAQYLNGLAMQKFPPQSEDDAIPVLKIKELGQSFCDNNSDKCTRNIKPEYIIHDGDVIFSWSGTLMVDLWCGGICGINQHLFKVTSTLYPKWFYLMWTKHHLAEFIRIAKDKAVTMGHIKRGDLDKALVLIPDDASFAKMTSLMNDIINKIVSLRLESTRLSSLRDTLLPKLMSGQIKP